MAAEVVLIPRVVCSNSYFTIILIVWPRTFQNLAKLG